MNMLPVELFQIWFEEQLQVATGKIPSACCFSTNGIDGFPNARFVALKSVFGDGFIVTGPVTSRKGMEIRASDKVALTFWWSETERQVRIQGYATPITTQHADEYFRERSRESQIVSLVSDQGQPINDLNTLLQQYENIEAGITNQPLARPENWSGYKVKPVRIEFLEFSPTRFHGRKLFELINRQWNMSCLQP